MSQNSVITLQNLVVSTHADGQIGTTTSVKVNPPIPCQQTNAAGNLRVQEMSEFLDGAEEYGSAVKKALNA